jgi:c-di-GMP-binding flagellar brake protein YcgR
MALGVAGVDHPEEKAVVDVIVPGRGEMLMSWVEVVRDDEIVVTVAQNRAGQPVRLDAGERLDLVWKGTEGLRSMPVELTATDRGERPVWRVRPLGPAARGQRRGAVRTPLRLTVRLTAGTTELGGATVDVSESGLRAVFDAPDSAERTPSEPAVTGSETADSGTAPAPQKRPLPEVGAVVGVAMQLDDEQITSSCEVIRVHPREDDQYETSLRFIGLSEYEQDLIRARVFAEMRDLRRRGLL